MRKAAHSPAPACRPGMHREDFPVLSRTVHGKPLVYFDNAATAQRPHVVIDAVRDFYRNHNANVHRGVHALSGEATDLFEAARDRLARFINAPDRREVIFTRGTTEAINLIAQSYLRPRLEPGDEILISHMEHHANIVPWQLVCEQTGAVLKVASITPEGELDVDAFVGLLGERTRLAGLVHVSNALGTINPVAEIARHCRARGVPLLVDGAQATPHLRVDVQALGVDFYALSGHKMYGPTGIGALWGRAELLEAMPPWQGGGEMIASVSFEGTRYAPLPNKFEAGTPNIAGAIGLGAACDYIDSIGIDNIAAAESELLAYATPRFAAIPGLRIVGSARHKAAVIAFTVDGVHPHDLGTLLDRHGIAIRTGHHCAMPLMKFFGVPATARASLAFYNTFDEIDRCVAAIRAVREMLC